MAKIRQFWLVVPLDIKEDGNQGRFTTIAGDGGLAFAEDAPRPARAGRLEPAAPATGYGFKIMSGETKRMNTAFTSKQLADDYAKDQAEKNPKVLFGVFGCEGTFETTTPTIIKKSFNEDGELTPVKE